jgi:hypothetical protein
MAAFAGSHDHTATTGEWTGDEQTVSDCTSQGKINDTVPTELFSLTDARGGYLSYLFFVFAIEHFPDGGDTIVTVHVDEHHPPSGSTLQFRLYEAIGIWPRDERAWGTQLFGKGGMNGAVYLTIKVPFASSIRVTAQIPPGLVPGQREEMLWACARAVVGANVRVTHGGLVLPRAARLRLDAVRGNVLKPFELQPMLHSPIGSAAAVVALTMLVNAPGLNSFEGCIRQHEADNSTDDSSASSWAEWQRQAQAGNASESGKVTVVAGGLEDVSSSSFYFQQVGDARYTLPEVGVTHFEWNPHGRVAMYRQFLADQMLLPSGKDIRWTWRNGETQDVVTGQKCISMVGPPIGRDIQNATVTTHVWYYELANCSRA